MNTDIRDFRIDVPQADLDDLNERLTRTRWVDPLPGDGWSRGVPTTYLQEWVEHWRTGYDWRAHEAELNQFPQYITEIEGYDVHFLHVRSPEPDALPLILTHGWPNSFVEFSKTVGPLTDPRSHGADPAQAFHVVVPSVPGFAFSESPRETGWSVERVARMWAELMSRLGHDRYGTQGGDLGAYVAPAVAEADPEHVVGVHIDAGLGFPTEADVAGMTDDERAEYDMIQQWAATGVDHHALLRAAPQTFAHAWHDSPVALLAWMLQKFQDFSPMAELPEHVIDRDHILTNVNLYWFTGTSGSSSWSMYDGSADGGIVWPKGQDKVPSGVYAGGSPLMRRLAERDNTVIHWPEDNPGRHHFIAMDLPDAHAADIREFFGKIR